MGNYKTDVLQNNLWRDLNVVFDGELCVFLGACAKESFLS